MDAYPPQSLPSIKDIIGDKYTWTNSLNSVPKCIAYLEGVLNRLSGGRLFPSPSAPKKKRGRLPQAAIAADEAPAPMITERSRPRWSSDEERRLRELVTELGTGRWAAIAMRLGTGRTPSSVEQRWSIFKQRSPEAAIAPAAAPTYDLAVGDRITMGGAPGVVVALPNPGGWWKVRRDGERTVRSARRAHIAPAATGAAPAQRAQIAAPGAAPAPTRKRPGAGGAAPRAAQRPRLVSRGGNDDDDAAKDAEIARLRAALAQAQQAPVAPPAALASVTGRLRELASLRASGALTEAQFERAKNTELGLQ